MVKDEQEITNQSNKSTSGNAQLSNDNRPKPLVKASPLSLVTNETADSSNIKLIAESKVTKFDNN